MGRKKTAKQLELTSIMADNFRATKRAIHKYIKSDKGKELHLFSAREITPNLDSWESIWNRIAFSILSANSPFSDTVKALNYATTCKGNASEENLAPFKMVPRKAEYLNNLPCNDSIKEYLKRQGESWHDYRLRLQKSILGLGLAKASFCACLLYPLDADLACLDTWMQKIFLGYSGFKQLSLTIYLEVENEVRAIASRHDINTFLAQWLIWDFARGGETNHNIFPGAHKESEVI